MIAKAIPVLFRISVAVWIISLIIHLLSAFQVDLLSGMPWLFYMQVIAIALFILSFLYFRWVAISAKHKLSWLVDPVPTGLIFLSLAGLPYCFANIFMAAGLPGSPHISEYDGYVLITKRGSRIITKEEYHFYQALSLRIMSSAGLALSGMAWFLFYPRKVSV